MNHQEIADRFEAIHAERLAKRRQVDADVEKELEKLRGLCLGIGHIFKRPTKLGACSTPRCHALA